MKATIERELNNFLFIISSDQNGDDWDIEINHVKYKVTEKNYKNISKAVGDKTLTKWLEQAQEVAQEWMN